MDVFTGPIKMCTEYKKPEIQGMLNPSFIVLVHRKTKHPHMKHLCYSLSPKIIYQHACEMCVYIYMMLTYISSIQTLVVMTVRCQISHKNRKYTHKYHSEFYQGK